MNLSSVLGNFFFIEQLYVYSYYSINYLSYTYILWYCKLQPSHYPAIAFLGRLLGRELLLMTMIQFAIDNYDSYHKFEIIAVQV